MKYNLLSFPACLFSVLLISCNNAETATVQSKTMESPVEPISAIAYIRNGSEIRLIDSNGQADRLLWTHPNAKEPLGLFDLAWRPDGKELAFSSAHESSTSIYHADIFGIRPDGSGFRKITNGPDHASLGRYKKGTVSVTFRNQQYSFSPAQSSYGVFVVTVVGAEEPQQITLPPGASKTVVFKNVADYGTDVQPIVAVYGNYRWYMPGTNVEAGKTVKAPDMIISGDGYPYFGAFRPVWKADGSVISYRDGLCEVKTIPAKPNPGEFYYNPLFGKEAPAGSCVWDWGPTPSTANLLLYSENESEEGSGFYLMKEGGKHDPSSRLALFSDIRYQIAHDLRWLPDGSGFLFSATNQMADASDLFRYDLKTKQIHQLTNLQGRFARRFCISPSGRWVVYEKAISVDDYSAVDLWLLDLQNKSEKLLVKNGLSPTWSR